MACTMKTTKLLNEIKNRNKWKDSYVQGLEDLRLLKCQYYPKQSTDSMQSLLKFQ